MNDDRLSAEDFARLTSLPEDHPERRRWAGSPEFEARLRLWREFETSAGGSLSAEDAGLAARELERRVESEVRGGAAGRGGAVAAPSRDAAAARPAGRSWLQRIFGAPPRAAVAFATILVVAVATTWFLARERTVPAERGTVEHAAIELMAPRPTANGIELDWTRVAGADGYRVVFYGAELTEVARIDRVSTTHVELRSGALPQGLVAHRDVMAEVQALHGEDVIATSKSRMVSPF
ncbi:MAG TPA: hypothetical protein VL123_08490 [Candidatus Udaeobacter sp.]|jgi:hypothetical protein|nr:hypothetical protein [Candidatus Udaeobacter sp.]